MSFTENSFNLPLPLSCTISIFQTGITQTFINSLAVCVKIAGMGVQIHYAGGKSIMIIKKKYQGISRTEP